MTDKPIKSKATKAQPKKVAKMADLLPQDDCLRDRLLLRGAGALTDAELLAVFLGTGFQGKSALDLAKELLDAFGDLRHLLWSYDQNPQFFEVKGLGKTKYAQLKACVAMVRHGLRKRLERGSLLNSPDDICYFLMSAFSGTDSEVFASFFLDTKHQMIAFENLFYGTIDRISVYPRVVVKQALKHNASALILAHNHPSGHTDSDYQNLTSRTQRLVEGLRLIEVSVLDYFVVGEGECVSLKEKGFM